MNEYARCAKHNLMRCGICNRPPKVTAPAPVTSVPAVGFDPSDLLDKPAEVLDGPGAPEPVIVAAGRAATLRAQIGVYRVVARPAPVYRLTTSHQRRRSTAPHWHVLPHVNSSPSHPASSCAMLSSIHQRQRASGVLYLCQE